MPIQRFGSWLVSKGDSRLHADAARAQPSDANLAHVMCRTLVRVDHRGYLYDCDFNQMLGMPLVRR